MGPIRSVVILGLLSLVDTAAQLSANHQHHQGPTVQVSVLALDTSPGTLHYQWKSTDGRLVSADAPTVNWTLPAGPGLHFAYVLVSNGLGGYTEKRIAVNTDSAGEIELESRPLPYTAPTAPTASGDTYRSSVLWGTTTVGQTSYDVHPPDVSVYMLDNVTNIKYPASGPVKTDLRGDFVIPNLPPGNNYTTFCQPPGTPAATFCSGGFFFNDNHLPMPNAATTDYLSGSPTMDFTISNLVSGNVALQDGSPCGTVNEFFGVHSSAVETFLDGTGKPLGAAVRTNELGHYSLVYNFAATPAAVSIQCEGAAPVVVPLTPDVAGLEDFGTTVIPNVSAPKVQSMTATLNGSTIATVNFASPAPTLPSDIVSRADAFLAEKGLDTRLGACQYYKAIGATQDCGATGTMIAPITFNDWKRAVKIGSFAKHGVPTFQAAYINKVDLNLARVHQSITYGPNQTAAVVCNHLGPPDFFDPPQAEVDTAVDNAVQNKNLVACVAMDYMISPGVNNNQPFIRFLIFGPDGGLLPSINLDGRREKFVPGTCIVCHGGDHYAGKFPEDGSGAANVGGHFLPYDTGNFEFSSKAGLREQDQEQAIFHLNQNVLNAGPTQAERELIAGWYANQARFTKVLDKNYIDPSWNGKGTAASNFYQHVYARGCRSCHVALVEGYNFDHYQNITPGAPFFRADTPEVDVRITTCGGDSQVFRSHSMANSLVTFNRFWLSGDPTVNTTGQPNQPDEFTQFLLSPTGRDPCVVGQLP
jgi:hypothetical protein